MIGKNEWFSRRKYGGWGLTPKTWQGYAYIIAFITITFGLLNVPGIPEPIRFPITCVLIAIICLDLLHIMATLKKDELEVKIEALAERNAAWTMVGVIVIGIGYQAAQSMVNATELDYFLVITLFGGVIAKAITNFWLEHKGL